jgi:hypothetical protein
MLGSESNCQESRGYQSLAHSLLERLELFQDLRLGVAGVAAVGEEDDRHVLDLLLLLDCLLNLLEHSHEIRAPTGLERANSLLIVL